MDEFALKAIAEAAKAGSLDFDELRKFIDPTSHDKIKALEAENRELSEAINQGE